MRIEFTYTQVLPTIHPFFEVTVNFFVTAKVTGEDVTLTKISANVESPLHQTAEDDYIGIPDESTHAGAMFAGLLREAARNEAHRTSKQAVREAAQTQTT